MSIVDSDIIIWILRENKTFLDWMETVVKTESVSISAMTVAEVYKNVKQIEVVKTEKLFDSFRKFDITYEIAKQGGIYWSQYHSKLKNLSVVDCLIAATSKLKSLTLYTLNTRHFPMKDILVINPLQ